MNVYDMGERGESGVLSLWMLWRRTVMLCYVMLCYVMLPYHRSRLPAWQIPEFVYHIMICKGHIPFKLLKTCSSSWSARRLDVCECQNEASSWVTASIKLRVLSISGSTTRVLESIVCSVTPGSRPYFDDVSCRIVMTCIETVTYSARN